MTWTARISLLLAAAFLTSCRKQQELGPPRTVPVRFDGALELTIASFNIRQENDGDTGERSWVRRIPRAVRSIRAMEPDILGIQEAHHGQAADLWASLPGYDFRGDGRDDGRRSGEYSGIYFRRDRFEPDPGQSGTFWLSGTPDSPGSMTWGNTYPRIVTWLRLTDRSTGRGFYVFNTHWDHRHQGSREQAALLIAGKIDSRPNPSEPVILLGDFNAIEDNPAIRYLRGETATLTGTSIRWENHLVDTFHTLHPAESRRRTFHPWNGDRGGNFKLDHIFVSQGAGILEASIRHDDPPFSSDHYPVTARVIFPPPAD